MSTARESLSVEEAIGRLRDRPAMDLGDEQVATLDALNRVAAEAVVSAIDVPPTDNSAMDGYAVNTADLPKDDAVLAISQRIAAGQTPLPLAEATAARIFTGAPIPGGADAVQIQEHCEADDGSAVRILRHPRPGANIRRRGQDIEAGQTVVAPGARLRPQELGLIASVGVDRLRVRHRLRVAVVSTGSELAEPGAPLQPGQIYSSNRFTLDGMLRGWGFDAIQCEAVRDNLADTKTSLERAADAGDAVISLGGVSVGEEDHVKQAVAQLGRLDLWKIAMKPGKPVAAGEIAGTPFLGLPGNPVSAFVTCAIIARPWLMALQGCDERAPRPFRVSANFDNRGSDRQQYLRVRLGDDGAETFPTQSSGVMTSTSWSDGLAVQPPHRDILPGDDVAFLPWSSLLS